MKRGSTLTRGKSRHLLLTDQEVSEFWSRVCVCTDDECWEWQGGRNSDGYGYFKQRRTHRLAYSLRVGTPENLVLHRCHNRLCCNPAHLYDGKHSDNMQDMAQAGSHDGKNRRNTKHPLCKLSNSDVRKIRVSGATGISLSKRFGVSQSLVSSIRNRSRRLYV